MKKLSPWLIITWLILFVAGIAAAVIGVLTSIPDSLSWFIAALFWVASISWIIIRIVSVKASVKKTGVAFLGNQQVFSRISKETQEAVARYTDAVNRRGILKKSALYERPWFLLCGTSKAGKSSLLAGSGLSFPLRYPSEKDGLIVEGAPQVMWYFANEAVWIDTPGCYMEDENKDEWQALIAALKDARPVNPVDGIALVVDTSEVLNSDDKGIKDLARKLRSRIDELISQWGIEFPVYLLFNRTDEVPGFKEYFGEQLKRSQEQIFGATLSAKSQSITPRFAFIEEFNILCKSLTDLRLDKLHKERDEAKKRMICRFVIHFEGIQQKLGSLIAELFKSSSYEGKPIFRGFYFTSCFEQKSEQNTTSVTSTSSISSTIVNHPLNPNKAFGTHSRRNEEQKRSALKEVKSVFVLPLFREIMVKNKSLVKATQKRTRKQMVRHYSIIAALTVLVLVVCAYMFSAYKNTKTFLHEAVQISLEQLPAEDAPLIEQYKAMDVVRSQIVRLQKYDDHGAPLSMRLGFYKGKKILLELKKSYFYRIRRFMVVPAVRYLEYDIRGRTDSYGELAGKEYDDLYRSLKAYLLISEGAPSGKNEKDTVLLRKVLFEGIKKSILATIKTSRLPTQVETILNENMGLYLFYLCRGEFPKIQENQRLVSNARRRLSRLPGARSLYEAVISKLSSDVPEITLDQILKRESEGILKSNKTISALYTQEGFDQFVSDALTDASRNPFKVDWVIGMTKDDLPESAFDNKKLRSDMMEAYLSDFKVQWLGFLGSVETEPFGDMKRSSRILQKLAAEGSELQILVETVADYSQLKNESIAEKAGSSALEAASKLKSSKITGKVKGKVNFSLGSSSPFDNHNQFFENLRKFVRSSGGALGGFEGYKDKILTLAEKLNTVESQGEQNVINVFNGKESDPLLDGWNYTQNTLNNMPEELSSSLGNLLLNPFRYTGTAVSDVLANALNSKWQTEVVKNFTERFSGRFPFNPRGEDASFNDFMDFFRPATGTFWGFYDRILSAFIVKKETGWMVKSSGTLQLNFNPDLAVSLSSAERIKNIFFKQDGSPRSMDITITPSKSNKNKADLVVDGQVIKLHPGGKSAYFKWPAGQNKSTVLKIYTGDNFSQDITFSGEWGFMKLINKAQSSVINNSSFSCKWQLNVQNTYMVYIDARIAVAGADHPFSDPVFRQFSYPAQLVKCGSDEIKN